MFEGCPSESTLDAFAESTLVSPQREDVATHVSTCSRCAGRIGHVVARVSLRGPTQIDSPAALRRRGGDAASMPPLAVVSSGAEDGTSDTVMSSSGARDAIGSQLGKGSTLSRYVVLERLGKGGMGEVYAAFDPDLDRKVAVKLLRADLHGSQAMDEMGMRMLREAQAMAKLAHPNVVTVHDVGLIGDRVFIAMEFLEGLTVTEWLKAKPRTWLQILDIFIQAGRGLVAAHDAGLTHRDFKPDNIVVSRSGRVRVLDFGLAHAQAENTAQTTSNEPEATAATGSLTGSGSGAIKGRRITQPGTVLGTPAYMAPEQLMGKPTDPRSDQFSFCSALYESLYGERPFAGETAPALLGEILLNHVRPAPSDSLVPKRIRRLLLRGLRAEPAERYRTMSALLVGLSRRRAAIVQQWIGLGAAAVVGLTGTAFYVQHQRSAQRCAEAADRFRGVWGAPEQQLARNAFLQTGSPWAQKAWGRIVSRARRVHPALEPPAPERLRRADLCRRAHGLEAALPRACPHRSRRGRAAVHARRCRHRRAGRADGAWAASARFVRGALARRAVGA